MRKLAIAIMMFAFCLALTPPAHSQGTFTAASCNRSDVNAVINGPTHVAVNGDTIVIPAGSCTWTTGIIVPSNIGITITGSGAPSGSPGTLGAPTSCAATAISTSAGFISMSPTFGNSTSRVSCMQVSETGLSNPVIVRGTCTSSGCPNFRMDNLTVPVANLCGGISDNAFSFVSNVFGVADHNSVGLTGTCTGAIGIAFVNLGNSGWQGVGDFGDSSWASPDTLGTSQTFFLENNNFNVTYGTDTDIPDGTPGGGGARFVCRFNSFANITSGGVCTGHGTDTTGRPRGVREWEAYYNSGTCSNPTQGCGSAWPGRSGVGMSFGNSFTNTGSGFFKGLADFDAQRTWRGSSWGECNGTFPWDTNDGVTYYSGTVGNFTGLGTGSWTVTNSDSPGWAANQWTPVGAPYTFWDATQAYGVMMSSNTANAMNLVFLCESCISFRPAIGDSYKILRSRVCMDQANRGAGQLLANHTPVLVSTGSPGPVNEVLDPSYEAADNVGNHGDHTFTSDSPIMIANRDWYAEGVNQGAQTSPTSPFNGSTSTYIGAGHGTLANRPTTCTPSVGYWATDQGSWNTSGTNNPIGSNVQGQLYVCTSTDTWTPYYKPYTYPHPLTTGGTTENPPNPPTSLQVTVH